MGHKFGSTEYDQMLYKNAQLEKQNKELIVQANELGAALNHLKQKDESSQRVIYMMLYELGGSIELSHEEFAAAEGKIMANVDEEKHTTTFFLQGPEIEEETFVEVKEPNVNNVLRFKDIRKSGEDSGRLLDM